MSETLYIPFPRDLYDDLVRFSDGRIDPAGLAVSKVQSWIDGNFACARDGMYWDDDFPEYFGERLHDFAEKYAPDVLAHWADQQDQEAAQRQAVRKPLVWKEVTIAAGSEVRMSYGGNYYYAKVQNGRIVDEDGGFSPSEWAYKVANRTSRNAWRDLWFKEPGAAAWMPAQLLREQAIEARSKLLAGNNGQTQSEAVSR